MHTIIIITTLSWANQGQWVMGTTCLYFTIMCCPHTCSHRNIDDHCPNQDVYKGMCKQDIGNLIDTECQMITENMSRIVWWLDLLWDTIHLLSCLIVCMHSYTVYTHGWTNLVHINMYVNSYWHFLKIKVRDSLLEMISHLWNCMTLIVLSINTLTSSSQP